MLINRDLVSYMATEIVKKLNEGELVEVKSAAAVTQRVRQAMSWPPETQSIHPRLAMGPNL